VPHDVISISLLLATNPGDATGKEKSPQNKRTGKALEKHNMRWSQDNYSMGTG